MKKLIILFALLIPVGLSAQGFFDYVPTAPDSHLRSDGSMISWAFRPAATVSAVQLVWDKEEKTFTSSGLLASAGVGFSVAHFRNHEGVYRSDYGFNLLYLFDTRINGEPIGSSVVAGVTAFESISFGAGYNFGLRAPVILLGVTYNFNRPLN